jgi:hypothetical protein
MVMRVIGRCMFWLFLLTIGGAASAAPTIAGNVDDARCREALHMANAAFQSNSPTLLWPIAQPSRATTRIILRQNYEDITGGHALEADPSEFAALRQEFQDGYPFTTY